MVTQINNPWTLEARQLAAQKEIRFGYDEYFARAAIDRAWFPHRLNERIQLRKWSHFAPKLDPKIKKMLLGFLAVESFVDDYVYAGIAGAGNDATTREMVYQWGIEERRHGQTFRLILIESGLMTQAEVDQFLDECAKDTWEFERQTGFAATVPNATAYGSIQEPQTRHNYTSFRGYLRREFERTGNPLLPIIESMVGYVERDEVAHGNRFIDILRVYLKYLSDQAFDSMVKAFDHYTMPIVEFPGKIEFAQALVAAEVFSLMDFGREVLKPQLRKMGLANRRALLKVQANYQNLPEDAIIQIQGKPIKEELVGATIYEMTPQGEFCLVA